MQTVYMTHELKIWPDYYKEVAEGGKTFEVRLNDRDYKKGDIVILKEYDPHTQEYTNSPPLAAKIGYVFPLDVHKVVFSLLEITTDLK